MVSPMALTTLRAMGHGLVLRIPPAHFLRHLLLQGALGSPLTPGLRRAGRHLGPATHGARANERKGPMASGHVVSRATSCSHSPSLGDGQDRDRDRSGTTALCASAHVTKTRTGVLNQSNICAQPPLFPATSTTSSRRSVSTSATRTRKSSPGSSRKLRSSEHGSDGNAPAATSEGSYGASANGAGGGSPPTAAIRVEDDRVEPVELHEEMTDSYVAYAMSVIVGRALPDARDGLKPVHRRILYAMRELGLASNKPFRKCARVVGEVLGKFHPHGDTAVYDALVRMAQDFSLRFPLVSGHGNFGSIDADPPAAMRYTECRLQPLAEKLLLEDLESGAVAFAPNFDGSSREPSVLPAKLPLLLINGSQGIAVGMATNIPPHNLGEVVDALVAYLRHPKCSVQELMEHISGPDFPTGGTIIGRAGIEDAYLRGKGSLVVRGCTALEELGGRGGRNAIVISELPYQTNKAAFVEKVADLVNSKAMEGISDLRDESDRAGMRVVVELKKGHNPLAVLGQLYRLTPLQSRFSCNFVGLVQGEPREMTLRDFFRVFVDFRIEVVVRRADAALARAQERDHQVQGLLAALDSLDLVVRILRSSVSAPVAAAELKLALGLSDAQVEGILGMPLRRLTGLEREKLEREHASLLALAADLADLIGSRKRVLGVIEKEALALKEEFGSPRRTQIDAEGDKGPSVDLAHMGVENAPVLISMSERGYVKRMSPDAFRACRKGALGKSGGRLKGDDEMCQFVVCGAHNSVLFFSDRGTAYNVKAYQVPEASRTAMGQLVSQLLPLAQDERVTSMLPVSSFSASDTDTSLEDGAASLVMLTRRGFVKKTPLQAFSTARKSGLLAIQLEEGDELKWVRLASDSDTMVVGSRLGNVVRFPCSEGQLRRAGRGSKGSKAMQLAPGDEVAAMDIIPEHCKESAEDGPWLLVVTERGVGKRVPVSAFEARKRGQKGVIGIKLGAGDALVALHVVGATKKTLPPKDVLGSSGIDTTLETTDSTESPVLDGAAQGSPVLAAEDEPALSENEEVLIGSVNGIVSRIRVSDVKSMGRLSRGSSLMRMAEGDRVSTVSII